MGRGQDNASPGKGGLSERTVGEGKRMKSCLHKRFGNTPSEQLLPEE